MSRRKKRIITIAAAKGGTAKTATAVSLAGAAVQAGKRVLLIDLDPQASASIWLGADFSRPGSYDLFTGAGAEQAIQETASGVYIIAGSANLAAITTRPGSAKRLLNALQPITGHFDLTLIDTAPAVGELQNNALYASTGLLIPLTASSLSLQGFYQIMDIARHIQASNEGLQITGVIVTQYDSRPKIARFMRDTIRDKATEAGAPYLGEIRQAAAVREAEAMQQPLTEYAATSKPAADYQELYKKIMEV